jgi:hypothetical protein
MKLYDSRSEDQFNVTYEKGSLEIASAASGICLGQSVVWCKNMLDGMTPRETKPGYGRAAAVATLYLWALKSGQPDTSSLLQACSKASVTSESMVEGQVYTVFWQITHNPGVYLVTIRGHAMAAACRGNKFYFYDPSDGCYEYDSVVDFNRKMLEYHDYLGARKVMSN